MSKVIRMNVLLTPQQKKRLEHISKTSGAPVAVIIRRAIDKEIGTSTTVKPGRPVEKTVIRNFKIKTEPPVEKTVITRFKTEPPVECEVDTNELFAAYAHVQAEDRALIEQAQARRKKARKTQ